MRKYLYILVGFMVICCLTSCQKESIVDHGELIVHFVGLKTFDYGDYLEVRIFSINNEAYPIYEESVNAESMKIELNAGEYIIAPSSNKFYPKTGFVVLAGKTTNIYYENGSNIPRIVY